MPFRPELATMFDEEASQLPGESRLLASGVTPDALHATVTGRRGKLRPGDYTLLEGMSNGAAIDALVAGGESNGDSTTGWTAKLMSQPFGRWLVALAGGLSEPGLRGPRSLMLESRP